MKAYLVETANGSFREVEMTTPLPKEGKALVRIQTGGINPLDTKIGQRKLSAPDSHFPQY